MSVNGSAETTNNLNSLRGKIASLAPYSLDQTLSVEGSAAESKAVGDALKKKVSFTDIVDNLNTSEHGLPLSANQGVVLKNAISQLQALTEESISETQTSVVSAQSTADRANAAAEDAQSYAAHAQETADSKLSPDGSVAMQNNLNLDDNKIVNLADPDNGADAATKQYVDSRTIHYEVVLSKNEWATYTSEAPYYQSISLAGILATDEPHYAVVLSGDVTNKQDQKDAFALIDDLETEDGTIKFTCFYQRPDIDITVLLEVNRGTSAT